MDTIKKISGCEPFARAETYLLDEGRIYLIGEGRILVDGALVNLGTIGMTLNERVYVIGEKSGGSWSFRYATTTDDIKGEENIVIPIRAYSDSVDTLVDVTSLCVAIPEKVEKNEHAYDKPEIIIKECDCDLSGKSDEIYQLVDDIQGLIDEINELKGEGDDAGGDDTNSGYRATSVAGQTIHVGYGKYTGQWHDSGAGAEGCSLCQ